MVIFTSITAEVGNTLVILALTTAKAVNPMVIFTSITAEVGNTLVIFASTTAEIVNPLVIFTSLTAEVVNSLFQCYRFMEGNYISRMICTFFHSPIHSLSVLQ
jgi:hypothetical protein